MSEIDMKPKSFLTEEAKKDIQNLLDIDSGGGGGSTSIEIDDTLTVEGAAADAKAAGDAIANIHIPEPSEEQIAEAVNDWLEEHPEAITVQDGSITKAKLNAEVIDNTLSVSGSAADAKTAGDEISGLKNALNTKAPGIYGDTTTVAYSNVVTNETQVMVYGNTFEHETVKLYDKGLLDINNISSGSGASGSVTFSNNNGLLHINVTASARIAQLWTMSSNSYVPLPSNFRGKNVTLRVVSDKPCSVTEYASGLPFRFQVYLRKEGTTGDGRQVAAASIGVVDNTYVDATVSFDVNADDGIIYVIPRYIGAGSSFDNVNFKLMVYESTANILDTEETITNGESKLFDIPATYTVVGTGCHKNALYGVVDTKEYVDSHVPSDMVTLPKLKAYIPNVTNLGYVTPEMFNAVGNGTTDDSTAIQSALTYAANNQIPFKAFGSYRINTGVIYAGNMGNIYFHYLDYRGSGGAAFTLRGEYNKVCIDEIYAYFSTAGGVGFRLETTETTHAHYNDITVQTIYANGNAVEFLNLYGATNGSHLYYNKFYTSSLYSSTANCIYLNGYRHFAENSFWGKHVSNNNGYFLYCANDSNNSSNKFYEFCIENASKSGVHGVATLIRCRTVECADHKTSDFSNISGDIFVFENMLPVGRAKETDVPYVCVNVENAATYEDRLEVVKNNYEASSGGSATLIFDAAFPNLMKNNVIGHTRRIMPYISSAVTMNSDYVPSGNVIAYFNHKGYVPDVDWIHDITVSEYHTFDTDRCFPTIFNIKENTTIYLDDSYCPVGINKFKVVQEDGKKAVIYDHNNVKVFDGQTQTDGTYIITCELTPHRAITIETSKGTISRQEEALRGIYFGDNERWLVEKPNYIS